MKLLVLLVVCVFYSYAPPKFPMASMAIEKSIVTKIDTLANRQIKAHFMQVSTPKPLVVGQLHVGDSITGFILTKP